MTPAYLILWRLFTGGLFYAGWVALMWAAAEKRAWIGVLATVVILIVHFCLTHQRLKDLILVLTIGLAGTVIDSLYLDLGLIEYMSPNRLIPWLAPFWLTSIYALLAINLDHSMGWMRNYLWFAAILGAAGAEASYLAAVRMGAAQFSSSAAMPIIGIVWILFLPGLYLFSTRLDHWLAPNGANGIAK